MNHHLNEQTSPKNSTLSEFPPSEASGNLYRRGGHLRNSRPFDTFFGRKADQKTLRVLVNNNPWLKLAFAGILLGLTFTLSLMQTSASGFPQACGIGEESCRVSAGFSGVSSGGAEPGTSAASSPAFGALVYDPDLKALEATARAAFDRALDMRLSISPYQQDNNFVSHVRKLDVEAGFTDIYTPTTPYGGGQSLNSIVVAVEEDLRLARDTYAFLLVHANEARFRADSDYSTTLCANAEDPYPAADPAVNPGEVLPPVIDYCNFSARLRQSVREAANMRMIYGQEFKVDALGVNFSASTVGGEVFVQQELANLRAAKFQFEQAEAFLADGLRRSVGSGCLVSDFYSQNEWSLLSRVAEEQGNLQYHIASRLSYLGVGTQESAQAAAQDTFRDSIIDQHIKLIGMAGTIGDGAPKTGGCAVGELPDGNLVADMATSILETQQLAREMRDGRNIFGFDVTMTPARHYKSSTALNCNTNAGARGLWDQAKCQAEFARSLQIYQEDKERDFERTQGDLRASIDAIRSTLDVQIDSVSGCNATSFGNDEAGWIACVEAQQTAIDSCIAKAHTSEFAGCMAGITGAEAQTALYELNGIYLEYKSIQTQMHNINARVNASNDANATVETWLLASGSAETAASVAAAAFDAVACVDFSATGVASVAACAGAGIANATVQATAGAISTAANVEIANAENNLEITNLILDQTELMIDAQAAYQAFQSKKAEITGMASTLGGNLRETLRQRAWYANSPANDPSFRIMRDSARLVLASELEQAAQIAYLAARRAEYEYAYPLYQANGFRISDIYRARTADDILSFLSDLENVTSNLPGNQVSDVDAALVPRISVAQHVLLLTDDVLISEGFTTPSEIETERTRRFREWVADNTVPNNFEHPFDNKPVLRFEFPTSVVTGGLFSNVIQQGYDSQWLLKLGGRGFPYAQNTGLAVNVKTDQSTTNMTYRSVDVEQDGMVHMRSLAGCALDFRLVKPASMLGFQLPAGQNPESAIANFSANVNDHAPYTNLNMSTSGFEGRPISATSWKVTLRAGAPELNQVDMDLQQLTDLELIFSITKASRTPGAPDPADCARADW